MKMKLPASFYDNKTNIGKAYSFAKNFYFSAKGSATGFINTCLGRKSISRPFTLQNMCEQLEVKVPAALNTKRFYPIPRITCRVEFCRKNYAFFAIRKENEAKECADAMARGAAVLFSTQQHYSANGEPYPCVIVPEPLEAYIKLCSALRSQLNAKVIALTGSVGKTTTKDMLDIVLSEGFKTSKSRHNSNGFASMALNLQKIDASVEMYIQECGAAFPGLILRDARVLCPDCVVITNVGYPHIDLYGSIENTLNDKLNLVRYMSEEGIAVLNADDERLGKVQIEGKKIVFFGIENKAADYRAENISFKDGKVSFDIVYQKQRVAALIHTYGIHNVYNALAAFAIGKFYGISDENIVKALSLYTGETTRQNLCEVGGYRLFVDCYNSAPNSIVGSVEALNRIPVSKGGRHIAVMGDIVRLGDLTEKMHRKAGVEIAEQGVDKLVCFGKDIRFTYEEAKKRGIDSFYTENREELNEWLRKNVRENDVTLFKAGHPTYLAKSIDAVFGSSFHLSDGDVIKLGRDISEKGFKYKEIDSMAEVRGATKKSEMLVVPEKVQGLPVVRIGKSAFSKNNFLRSVEMGSSIYNIGFSAFYNCKNLESVEFSTGLMLIERSAFNGCSSLKSAVLPEGVREIGERAFYKCTALEEITIPCSVKAIGKDAFKGCEKLTVRCKKGSFAYDYAKRNSISIKEI